MDDEGSMEVDRWGRVGVTPGAFSHIWLCPLS